MGSLLAGARKACEGIPWTLAYLDGQHTLPHAHQVRSLCEVRFWEPGMNNRRQYSAATVRSWGAETASRDSLEDLLQQREERSKLDGLMMSRVQLVRLDSPPRRAPEDLDV
jgi:hypothetical protein